ncbi:hypothetical protein HPB48_013169 [Haemaphysalis longicornis]|uniref:Uncharacterized protein n=1 Tax=Haemaphysalis longicornis TaxID=44386 RepID=A0A9J6FY67_HAELO|nr:hypothetical protein HPB48_013169 [Haemaphysalis longicornis]
MKDMESIFLDIHDADLGSSFLEHLQGMRLSPEDENSLKRWCFAFIKACSCDLQKRLPSSTSLVRNLRAISPQSILGLHAMQGLKTLPNSLFSCSERRIEEQVRCLRQVESVQRGHARH